MRPDVLVVSTGHEVADARLHRLCGALVGAGMGVGLDGLGDRHAGPPGTKVTTRPRPTRLGRLLRAAALPWRGRGASILVVVDPELVLPGTLWRSLRPGRRLVVDVHEDYRALLADRPWATGARGTAAALLVRAARGTAARADLTILADEHLPPLRARTRLVVRNLPRLDELPPECEPDPTPRALYVGDVRRSRGLRRMVDAVLAVPPWELDVVGPLTAADRPWLGQRLSDAGADRARIRLHGRLPPARAWPLARGAWVGLTLLDDTPAFRGALPTKLYEYLGSGLAVLTSPLPRAVALVQDAGAGLVAAGTHEAAACLRRWLDEPALLNTHRDAARAWAVGHLAGRDEFAAFADAVRTAAGP